MDTQTSTVLAIGPQPLVHDAAWALLGPDGTIQAETPYQYSETIIDAVKAFQCQGVLPRGFAEAFAEPWTHAPPRPSDSGYLHPAHIGVQYRVRIDPLSSPPHDAITVELPALHGGSPFPFLAALGVLTLLEAHRVPRTPEPRLSWSPQSGQAQITAPGATLEGIEATLVDCAQSMAACEQVIYGVDGFPLPLPTGSGGGDPLRVPIEQAETLAEQVHESGGPEGLAWLRRLVDLRTPDTSGRVSLSPYLAPRGKQNIHTFFAFPLRLVVKDPVLLIGEALRSWRRVIGCTGENLDVNAPVPAAQSNDGKPYNRGVPGATWLATQALALTELSSHPASSGPATLWHYLPNLDSRGSWLNLAMVWPLWQTPLTRAEVAALLARPGYRVCPTDDGSSLVAVEFSPGPQRGTWTRADQRGVFTARAALRPVGEKSLGPLVPHHPQHV